MEALQDESLLATLTAGTHVYKHDFSREKRARKLLQLSSDGSSLSWKNAAAAGSSAPGSPLPSGSPPPRDARHTIKIN